MPMNICNYEVFLLFVFNLFVRISLALFIVCGFLYYLSIKSYIYISIWLSNLVQLLIKPSFNKNKNKLYLLLNKFIYNNYYHLVHFCNISVGTRNILIHPRKNQHKSGDTITCSAAGNPNPVCRWLSILSHQVNDAELLITSEVHGYERTYQCTCTNHLHSTNKIVSFNITDVGE